jgi:hypothetical protein
MLQGCSDKNPEDRAASAGDEPQHVWKEQVKALDKARNLEEDMNAAFRRRTEDIDAQSR